MTFKHGTEWGARLHVKRGEEPCRACKQARSDATTQRREERRNRPIPPGLEHGEYVRRDYGCDCKICLADTRAKTAERKRRSRANKKQEVS